METRLRVLREFRRVTPALQYAWMPSATPFLSSPPPTFAFKINASRRFFLYCRPARRLRCCGGNREDYRPNPCWANLSSRRRRLPRLANGNGSIEGPLALQNPIEKLRFCRQKWRCKCVSSERESRLEPPPFRPVFRLRRPRRPSLHHGMTANCK